jgi:hypothetical protein
MIDVNHVGLAPPPSGRRNNFTASGGAGGRPPDELIQKVGTAALVGLVLALLGVGLVFYG